MTFDEYRQYGTKHREIFELVLNELHSDSIAECTMLLLNIVLPRVWVRVNCSLEFPTPYFICEKFREHKVFGTLSNATWCTENMIFLRGFCFRLMNIKQVKILKNNLQLDEYKCYLNSLLKYKATSVLFNVQDGICIYAEHDSTYDQIVNNWRLSNRSCTNAEWSIKLSSPKEYKLKCPDNQFQCLDGPCITSIYECDNVADCSDNSDELFCSQRMKGAYPVSTC